VSGEVSEWRSEWACVCVCVRCVLCAVVVVMNYTVVLCCVVLCCVVLCRVRRRRSWSRCVGCCQLVGWGSKGASLQTQRE